MKSKSMEIKHIIESQQFDEETMNLIFKTANRLSQTAESPLKGKIMASLFYESSTRTRFSFEAAMLRLGGNIITSENAKEFSSAAKGETIEDTIRVVSRYADIIVLRHPQEGASKRAAAVSSVPIINAGDGIGQHPTQALLDLYTIKKELGEINGTAIAFAGDLKNGRTVRSLAYLLGKYRDIKIYFISPNQLAIGNDIKEYLKTRQVKFEECEKWDDILGKIDVLYQTRIQKERFEIAEEYNRFKGKYILSPKEVMRMKNGSIIMHPLPRVDEITTEVDQMPNAKYFKQAQYGLLVRMALLLLLLE